MPMYTFCCNDCGTRKTEVARMADIEGLHPMCLQCGKEMGRDYQADLVRVHPDSYRRPIHSDALAVAPSQRKEHEQLYPYIKLDKKCRPVFDNYKDHQRYLDETGFRKDPGKSKRRTVKVS